MSDFYKNVRGVNPLATDDLTFIQIGKHNPYEGFVPTEQQLEAMNSGINSELVEQITTNAENIATNTEAIAANTTNISSVQNKTTAMSAGGADYIVVNSKRIYVGDTEPTGTIPEGSIWINTAVVNP